MDTNTLTHETLVEEPATDWVTDVYRRIDGRWLCVHTHVTPVAG